MDSNSKAGASFRLFVNDDGCTSIFQIPSKLVKSYGEILPPKATLRIDQSGKCWTVSIEKFRDQYFFTDGRTEFAEEIDLKSREFLLFKSAGLSKYHVFSEEINGCMQLNTGTSGDASGMGNSSLHVNCESKDFGVGKRLSFSKELKEDHIYRLAIPKYFVTGTGIAKNEEIILKDTEGRKWPVQLTERGGMLSLSKGWYDFLIGNKVLVGSTISFVSLSKNTVEAQIVEEGTNKHALFDFVKGRGNCFELDFKSDKKSSYAKVPKNSLPKVKGENEDDFSEEENGFGVGRRWRFTKELKKHHAYKLDIPKDFSMVIGNATEVEIRLMDEKGRTWPVQVKYTKCGTYRMTTGWKDFLDEKEVRVGSTISLKLIPNCDNVIKALVMDSGNKHKVLLVKRARGRPPSCFKMSTSP